MIIFLLPIDNASFKIVEEGRDEETFSFGICRNASGSHGHRERISALESRAQTIDATINSLTAQLEESLNSDKNSRAEVERSLKNLTLSVEDQRKDLEEAKRDAFVRDEDNKKFISDLAARLDAIERSRAKGPPKPLAPPSPAKSFESAKALYDKNEYKDAAIAFADNIEGTSGDEFLGSNLYWLGMSLFALGKTPEACKAFESASLRASGETKILALAQTEKCKKK